MLEQQRHGQVGVVPGGLDARGHGRSGQGHVAEQRDQAEHQRVGGQGGQVPPDHVTTLGGEHPGDDVRVHEQRQRRAEREGGKGPLAGWRHDQAAPRLSCCWVDRLQVRRRGTEDVSPAAEPHRYIQDRDEHGHVDQRVLDERDHGRSAQPGQVGVRGQDDERDDQGQVLEERVARAGADSEHDQHGLDADELQRDVRHGGQDPGERHGEAEAPRAVPAPDEVGRGDVVVPAGDRPESGDEDEYDREGHDRVGQGIEPRGAGRVHQRGHGDERIGGVDVAAEQEPADERAEPASAKAPLLQVEQVLGRTPPGRGEPDQGDDQEADENDCERDVIDVTHLATSAFSRPAAALGVGLVRTSRKLVQQRMAITGTANRRYQ